MKAKLIGGIAVSALVAYVVVSAVRTRPFAPAADLPRGALVYLQVEDLPGFMKLWSESSFKEKYLESQNFDDLAKRHLGLKIASRWQEFSDALGIPIDTDVVASVADKRAAVAVYDVGKLDIVFIAPMNAATFEATRLMQGSDKFDSEQLDDGTQIYRVDVDADKGRQKQQILFTHIKGRLIVATSEKLLAQTASIISGRLKNSALADDPAFSTLAARMTPKTAAVWVDQAALNADYYFKRYWLMSNVGSLENIRSGMFELGIGENEITEDRDYLLKEPIAARAVTSADSRQLMSRVPDGAPYYQIGRASTESMNKALASVLSLGAENQDSGERFNGRLYTDANNDGDDDYDSDKFDRYVNDADDEQRSVMTKTDVTPNLASAVGSAGPRAVLTLARSRAEKGPLFVDFDRAVVVTLALPSAVDGTAFERSLSGALAAHLLVHGQRLDEQWVTKTDKGVSWRELEAPALGWSVGYAIQGNHLIVANGPEFVSEVLLTSGKVSADAVVDFAEFTAVRPAQLRDDFQSTFGRLADKHDLFTGNILSLIYSAPSVGKIEITKFHQGNLMHEQLRMTLRPAEQQNKTATE